MGPSAGLAVERPGRTSYRTGGLTGAVPDLGLSPPGERGPSSCEPDSAWGLASLACSPAPAATPFALPRASSAEIPQPTATHTALTIPSHKAQIKTVSS